MKVLGAPGDAPIAPGNGAVSGRWYAVCFPPPHRLTLRNRSKGAALDRGMGTARASALYSLKPPSLQGEGDTEKQSRAPLPWRIAGH